MSKTIFYKKEGRRYVPVYEYDQTLMEEADKLLANPTVRNAYEKFLFVAELSKEHNNVT